MHRRFFFFFSRSRHVVHSRVVTQVQRLGRGYGSSSVDDEHSKEQNWKAAFSLSLLVQAAV